MTTPQTFAITVPHASSQLSLGRCACPDGASLTTVGSVLVDAVGTLTAQSDGAWLAQTNAAMSWLSQSKTEAHTSAGFQIYAGGGTAPGACGSGVPAASPGASKPGATTERIVNVTLSAASLARNVVNIADGSATGLAAVAEGLDGAKNVAEGLDQAGVPGVGAAAPYLEAGSGVLGGIAGVASAGSPLEALAAGLGAGATVASGAAGAAGSSTDIEERAVNEIKMVAGTLISGTAGVGFEWKTLNKFGVVAAALTSFTTTAWGAFCLLKFEVKAGYAVKAHTKLVSVHAKSEAKMVGRATLTFDSPLINYVSKLKVTQTLHVVKKTTVNSLEVKNSKKSDLDGTLTVEKNMVIHTNLTVKKNVDAKKNAKVTKKTKAKGAASVSGKTKAA